MQPGVPGVPECSGQARRDREDDAPVIALAGDDARLTGLDEFLETAADQKAFPLDHGLFGIEVTEGERLECPSRPGPEGKTR